MSRGINMTWPNVFHSQVQFPKDRSIGNVTYIHVYQCVDTGGFTDPPHSLTRLCEVRIEIPC